ncbi:MAG: hypothetical protein KDA25_07515 [Phycisphaerales bacterium]|nr:hypothetical protein [Phycisphaerales bacterium]
MNRITLIVALGLWLPALVVADPILTDDFNDGILDPAWVVDFQDARAWEASERGGQFVVTDITAAVQNERTGGIWAVVSLTRAFPPLDDLDATLEVIWDAADSVQAMQYGGISLLNTSGDPIVVVRYGDPWVLHAGAKFSCVDDDCQHTGINSIPLAGTATLQIERTDGTLTLRWDDGVLQGGVSDEPIAAVRLDFWHNDYVGPGGPSFFGTIAMNAVEVEGTLADVYAPADFNRDGIVDAADLATLLAAWGVCDGCPEDLDGDGIVGPSDLAMLLAEWG